MIKLLICTREVTYPSSEGPARPLPTSRVAQPSTTTTSTATHQPQGASAHDKMDSQEKTVKSNDDMNRAKLDAPIMDKASPSSTEIDLSRE